MQFDLNDALALMGTASLTGGVGWWLGYPAALITLGVLLLVAAWVGIGARPRRRG